MKCDGCFVSFSNYYTMGKLAVCEKCIVNTYPYQKLKGKTEKIKEEKEEYDQLFFRMHDRCSEYNSICSQRERLLEKIYMDIDKLKWEIDTDKYTEIRKNFHFQLLETGNNKGNNE